MREKLKGSFSRKNWTPWQAMRLTLGSILKSCKFFKKFIQICWLPYKPLNHSHGLIHMVLIIQRCAWYYITFHDTWIIKRTIFFLRECNFLPFARVLNLKIVYCHVFLKTLNLSMCADNSTNTIKFNPGHFLAVFVTFWILFHLLTLLSNLWAFLVLFWLFLALAI